MGKARDNFCRACGAGMETRELHGHDRRVCPDCGHTEWGNPTPVVGAIVEHEGKIILVRNVGWPESWFGLVTGFLERAEHPEEGILRELEEELGLTGEIVELVGLYPFEQMNQIIITYHVRAEGEIVLGEELEAFKAIPPEKLRPWPMGTGHAVRDWLEKRGLS